MRILLRTFILVLLVLAGLAGCRNRPAGEARVTINGHGFQVELAVDDLSRQRGLGRRANPPGDGHGMLFVFDKPANLSFHMKDCLFPIDLAFFDADGRIVSLHSMPVAANPAYPERSFGSGQPAQYALEVAGGTWQRLGIKEGMVASFDNVPGR